MKRAAALIITSLFVLALSGCIDRPEHVGPDASDVSVEATLAAKPPMNDVENAEVSDDEDTCLEIIDVEEEQVDSDNANTSDSQDDLRQEDLAIAATSSGSSSGGSSSGGGSSNQGSGQGSTQSGGSGSGGGNSGGSGSSGSGGSGSSGNNSTQTPAPQTITVSIEICARLAHAADPAAVAGISNAGVILPRRNVTVPTGASVRQALDATGVHLNARGAYIAGIGGLSEGDLGPQSGWMFSVNGAFSSQSASAHRLNAGDVIAWRYTINGGADLGASW